MNWLIFGLGATLLVWLCRRLWPAVRSEPSTWFGTDLQEQIRSIATGRERVGA